MSTKDLKLFDLLDGLEMTKSQYEWLARRFENMTAKEALLFRGAMQIEQPQATCDVMQIANQLEHYELLYGAGNDFALGNFVMEHIFYPSSQTREFLDPGKGRSCVSPKRRKYFLQMEILSDFPRRLISFRIATRDASRQGRLRHSGQAGKPQQYEGIWVGFPGYQRIYGLVPPG